MYWSGEGSLELSGNELVAVGAEWFKIEINNHTVVVGGLNVLVEFKVEGKSEGEKSQGQNDGFVH